MPYARSALLETKAPALPARHTSVAATIVTATPRRRRRFRRPSEFAFADALGALVIASGGGLLLYADQRKRDAASGNGSLRAERGGAGAKRGSERMRGRRSMSR
ncbi:MAG TPA: hypothetical protein VFA03_10980 [Acetobacteraceae bacterium]|nr:hypothetical protein [Acetobacteraceae bacterium]